MISSNECPHQSIDHELLSLILSSKRISSPVSYDQISELNLSHLNLIQVDLFPFIYFPKLRSLDLSHNELQEIPADWAKSSQNIIEYLNLSSNHLETLLFLKDFRYLKTLNISENFLQKNERFLSLYLCPTLEHLIDFHHEQIESDRLSLKSFRQLFQTNLDRYPKKNLNFDQSFNEFSQWIFQTMENSPCVNYYLRQEFSHWYRSLNEIQMKSIEDLTRSMNLSESRCQVKNVFRCHQNSDEDLTSIAVRMCVFIPNTSESLLVTCGGRKVCWIDCDRGEVTHVYQLQLSNFSASCLCPIEISQTKESLKIIAVGTDQGHVYLLSSKWKLMFGQIELPSSSVRCLTWHPTDPFTLVVASSHTVRCVNIRTHIDRLQSFIRKVNRPTVPFDYVDTTAFVKSTNTTHLFHLNGSTTLLITDLLFYHLSSTNKLVLVVATSAGLFVIRYGEKNSEQILIQLALPKSLWTVSEHIESLCLIESSTPLIAMNLLGLDRICCFNLDEALQTQQIHICLSFPNSNRRIPTKMAISSSNKENVDAFECFIGNSSISHHRIRMQRKSLIEFHDDFNELHLPIAETKSSPTILCSSVNEKYLAVTTNNNLICIYQR